MKKTIFSHFRSRGQFKKKSNTKKPQEVLRHNYRQQTGENARQRSHFQSFCSFIMENKASVAYEWTRVVMKKVTTARAVRAKSLSATEKYVGPTDLSTIQRTDLALA